MNCLVSTRFQHRTGITLLEVMISIFVVSVGLLSIFGLFIAGRELEAERVILSSAVTYANGTASSQARSWMDILQWVHDGNYWHASNADKNWRWVQHDDGTGVSIPATAMPVRLPVLIDPWGLNNDTFFDAQTSQWRWNQFIPAPQNSKSAGPQQVFARVSLSALEQTSLPANSLIAAYNSPHPNVPYGKEAILSLLADEDAVEYGPDPASVDNPPINLFELGRRKRGTDLVPALFLCLDPYSTATDRTLSAANAVNTEGWLLIFYKPFSGLEVGLRAGNPDAWPAGSLELEVTDALANQIETRFVTIPTDEAVMRRTLRPKKWVLITQRVPQGVGTGFGGSIRYEYDSVWRQAISVSDASGAPSIILDEDLPSTWITRFNAGTHPMFCYGFESLVYVQQLKNLPQLANAP